MLTTGMLDAVDVFRLVDVIVAAQMILDEVRHFWDLFPVSLPLAPFYSPKIFQYSNVCPKYCPILKGFCPKHCLLLK